MAKNDVTKGLDEDLFEASLADEPDNTEPVEEGAPEEAAAASDEPSEKEDAEATPVEEEAAPSDEGSESSEEGSVEAAESSDEGEEPSDAGDDATSAPVEPVEAEETAEPAQETVAEAAPVKRKRGRPPKQPKDDAAEDVTKTYEVQRGFTAAGGKTYHPGDVIPIKCKHCALWEKEWLGKVRCSAGRRIDEDTVMSSERFSCETFFICKEFDAELSTFLSMVLPVVLTVRSMLAGMKKMLGASTWLTEWAEKHSVTADLDAVFKNAKGYVMSFNSTEQLGLAEPFIRKYAQVQLQKNRPKRPPKPKFTGGDWVKWTDLETKQTMHGIILSIARGNIIIGGAKAQKGSKFTFKYKEWKKTRDPEITEKSADAE